MSNGDLCLPFSLFIFFDDIWLLIEWKYVQAKLQQKALWAEKTCT